MSIDKYLNAFEATRRQIESGVDNFNENDTTQNEVKFRGEDQNLGLIVAADLRQMVSDLNAVGRASQPVTIEAIAPYEEGGAEPLPPPPE